MNEFKPEDVDEFKRIINQHIPLGDANSPCHSGIVPQHVCGRCQDARKVRSIFTSMTTFFMEGEAVYQTRITLLHHALDVIIKKLEEKTTELEEKK